MTLRCHLVGVVALLSSAAACAPHSLGAQGVTGAVIQGRVTNASGAPVPNARVLVVGVANGERWESTTRSDGR